MLHLVVRACALLALALCFANTSTAQRQIIAGREYFDRPSRTWLDTFLVSEITFDDQGNIISKIDKYDTPNPNGHDFRVQRSFRKIIPHPDQRRLDMGPPDVIDEFMGYDSIVARFDSVYRFSDPGHTLTHTATRTIQQGHLASVLHTWFGTQPRQMLRYDFDDAGLITLNGDYDMRSGSSITTSEQIYQYQLDKEGNVGSYLFTTTTPAITIEGRGPDYRYDNGKLLESERELWTRTRYSGWVNYGKVVPFGEYAPLNAGNTWQESIVEEREVGTDNWFAIERTLQFFDNSGLLVRRERWDPREPARLLHVDSFTYYPNGDLRSRHHVDIHDDHTSDTTAHIRENKYDAKNRVTHIQIREGEGTLPQYLVRYNFAYLESDVARALPEQTQQRAYPNPTTGKIHLAGAAAEHVSVIDLTGKSRIEVNGVQSLDISSLPDGVYTLVVDGRAERIVKMRK